MDDEHVELVQAHALAPPGRQGGDFVVAGIDPIQVPLAEHAQGGQVRLRVRPLGERVDENADDVAPAATARDVGLRPVLNRAGGGGGAGPPPPPRAPPRAPPPNLIELFRTVR